MGFLDKLLGRGKDAAEDVGTKTEEVFDDAKTKVTGEEEAQAPDAAEGSEVTQAEQRLDNIRDQALRDEGRMP